MIAVLNGSTSANWNAVMIERSEIARMPTKATYLIIQSRSCSPNGNFDLLDAEPPRELVGKFLQRPERAQPAAEHAASPEQHADRDEAPEQEHHRIEQKQLPAKSGQQGVDERQDVERPTTARWR